MAILLVSDYGKDAEHWRDQLRLHIGDLDLYDWSDSFDANKIDVLLTDCPLHSRGGFGQLSNLRWVHYLGHGVGDVLRDPSLPDSVIVTRQRKQTSADSLAIYVVHALTHHHLRADEYRSLKERAEWQRLPITASADLQVIVLGLGIIGRTIARRLADLGYPVTGWSRSQHEIDGIKTISGNAALWESIGSMDYVVGVLPETNETTGLIDRSLLAAMKAGAYIINVGRGSLIVESDLLVAIDHGQIAGAYLDVFATEPLPPDDPIWRHPKVMVTPHHGGPPTGDAEAVIAAIAQNYRRFHNAEPLLDTADRTLGY